MKKLEIIEYQGEAAIEFTEEILDKLNAKLGDAIKVTHEVYGLKFHRLENRVKTD
jgi:hypothetical protein